MQEVKAHFQTPMQRGRLENFHFLTLVLHILKRFIRVATREAIIESLGVLETTVTVRGGLFRLFRYIRKTLVHNSETFYTFNPNSTHMLMQPSCYETIPISVLSLFTDDPSTSRNVSLLAYSAFHCCNADVLETQSSHICFILRSIAVSAHRASNA